MKRVAIVILFFFNVLLIKAQQAVVADSSSSEKSKTNFYSRPKVFAFLTNLPKDYSDFYKREFRKTEIKKYAAITALTGLLMLTDQSILESTQQFGDNINITGDDHLKALFEVDIKTKDKMISLPIDVPTDANSSMYYIGDGVTHFSICFGFWAYGKIAKDNRAVTTGEQILESLLAEGIATQFIKHITGRESPFVRTQDGGTWRFFPNQKNYADHVPHYDAFPTGHLATAVSTVTVIAENYPEWKMVKPIGYSLCGLLGFAMVNNGVHWASDYPLGIALGYSFAKIVTDRNTDESKAGKTGSSFRKSSFEKPFIFPASFAHGGMGLSALWSF